LTNEESILKVIEEVKNELMSEPDNPDLLNDLGVGYYLLGEYSKSVEELEKAVHIDPNRVSFLYNLGNSYAESDEFSSAILQYLKVLEIDPGHMPSLNNLADAYEHTGNSEKSFELFSYIVKIAPTDEYALFNLGNFLLRNNRHIEAVKCYEKVLDLNSGFVDAYYNIAWILSEAGAVSDARSYVAQGLEIAPDDEDLNLLSQQLQQED
jgi:tetratricopeptide (TPR) repeat protein